MTNINSSFNDEKNCFVKEKGQKESQWPSGREKVEYQIARGIKEGFERGHPCLCRTIWLSAGATNLTFYSCPPIYKTASPFLVSVIHSFVLNGATKERR
jgi:hypothetical protein